MFPEENVIRNEYLFPSLSFFPFSFLFLFFGILINLSLIHWKEIILSVPHDVIPFIIKIFYKGKKIAWRIFNIRPGICVASELIFDVIKPARLYTDIRF